MPDDLTLPDGAVRIPLLAIDGTVRAYAIVDSADLGLVAGHIWRLDADGYARRNPKINGRQVKVRMHRLLVGLSPDDPREPDHIDRDKLNNRRGNLRIVPHSGNVQNVPSYRGSTSIYRGVSWHAASRKWKAEVQAQGKQVYLGLYTSETEAAEAARVARRRLLPYSTD